MEKAILKTLIYADIFDYPLKVQEIHKWLIGPPSLDPTPKLRISRKPRRANRKVTLRELEKTLKKLVQSGKCKVRSKYYFLPRKNGLVARRIRREKQSMIYFKKAKMLAQILKLIPWIKLVGISGGLAVNNAGKKDDIDLFIITGNRRLWISRLLALGIISLLGQRRKKGEKGRKIAGKLCINILLEEDQLEQKNKDIFIAHEVLQMKVLWQRDGIYSKYLADNEWVFKFLPNWISMGVARHSTKKRSHGRDLLPNLSSKSAQNSQHFLFTCDFTTLLGDNLEKYAKWLQLQIMQKPQGMERIEDGALYFHPQDCRQKILNEYKKRVSKIDIGTS